MLSKERDGIMDHTYPSGSRYVGGWKDGKKHGKGRHTYAEGGEYEGDFADDKRHGKGCYKYSDGGVYTGEFRRGKREGFGTYLYADKSRYEGNWVDDMMEGQGRYFYVNNSNFYDGSWKADTPHGIGIIVEEGVQRRVEHKHGVLIHESEVPNTISQHAAQTTRSPNGGGGSSYPRFQPTSEEVARPAQGNSPAHSSGARDGLKKQSGPAKEDDWLGGLFSIINCTPCCSDMTAMSIQEHQTTATQIKEKLRGGAGTESIV